MRTRTTARDGWTDIQCMLKRETRLITCPENHQTAAVNPAWSTSLRLSACSRWPEKAGCDQACLSQIETSPQECLLSTVVRKWYEGKTCTLCHRAIEYPGGVISPEGVAREWNEFSPEQLPRIFATHQPLCWNCNNVVELIETRPDLVTPRTVVRVTEEPLKYSPRAIY